MFERAQPVICAGARTPIGRFGGVLAGLSAVELGGSAVKAALERAGVAPEQVQYVIMGQVLQAGAGQMPARQAAVGAGIPMSVPAADRQQGLPVRAGRDRAGRPADPGRRVRHRRRRRHGVDDQRPAPAARARARATSTATSTMVDHMALRRAHRRLRRLLDGRVDRPSTTRGAASPRASRTRSAPAVHQRAAAAQKNGAFAEEIAPVAIPQRKGEPIVIDARTRASGRTPPPRRWPSCARPSRRTARSPPAPPRRSPTAPARSS